MEMHLLALYYWLLSQVDAKFKQIARFPRTNFDMKLVNFLKKKIVLPVILKDFLKDFSYFHFTFTA